VDHAYSPERISSGERIHPLVTDELARIGCDGGIGASCRHLGDETWDNDPYEAVEFSMGLHAWHEACKIFDNPDGHSCQSFIRQLDRKPSREGLQPDIYGHLTLAKTNAADCQHDPHIGWASCETAYQSYQAFLQTEIETEEERIEAIGFLIDGCEVGDSDACNALSRSSVQSPEPISSSNVLRTGNTGQICNTQSNFTNLRSAPTSEGSSVLGQLPNTLHVTILDNVINNAGYLYYEVELQGSRTNTVNTRSGYVYHGTASTNCGLPTDVSPNIQVLSLDLARTNESLTASDSYAINANFDGTSLFLTNMLGLHDIASLAALNELVFLDLTRSSVTDVSPLANLTSLETLSLYYNDVDDITPLEGLTGLRTLNLRGSRVLDLSPLSNLTDLELLYLPTNRTDIDLTPIRALMDRGLRVE